MVSGSCFFHCIYLLFSPPQDLILRRLFPSCGKNILL